MDPLTASAEVPLWKQDRWSRDSSLAALLSIPPTHPYTKEIHERVKALGEIIHWQPDGKNTEAYFDQWGQARLIRDDLVDKYAWAIPVEEAIEEIVQSGPIVEIGAGTGYWAKLISEAGGDIIAFDKHPPPHPKNGYHKEAQLWFPVKKGTQIEAMRHSDRALMLCWPPYATCFADTALRLYNGDRVIFVGESEGGCTADERFFRRLNRDFQLAESVRIPQWEGIHDYLDIWVRKMSKP